MGRRAVPHAGLQAREHAVSAVDRPSVVGGPPDVGMQHDLEPAPVAVLDGEHCLLDDVHLSIMSNRPTTMDASTAPQKPASDLRRLLIALDRTLELPSAPTTSCWSASGRRRWT